MENDDRVQRFVADILADAEKSFDLARELCESVAPGYARIVKERLVEAGRSDLAQHVPYIRSAQPRRQ